MTKRTKVKKIINCVVCGSNEAKKTYCASCGKLVEKIIKAFSVRKSKSCDASNYILVAKKFINAKTCFYCCREFSKKNNKTLDHFIPCRISIDNSAENINISCKECNWSKAGMVVEDWVPRRWPQP